MWQDKPAKRKATPKQQCVPDLPPELWNEIFKFINPCEIYTTLKNVCWYWHNMILSSRTLPKIPVNCDVYVVDDGYQRKTFNEIIENPLPLLDPTDHYRFTVNQFSYSGSPTEKWWSGEFNISKRCGEIVGEAKKNSTFNVIPCDSKTTLQILSFFQVRSLRITVNKRRKSCFYRDDKLIEITHFLKTYCGGLDTRFLALRSESAEAPWSLSSRSLHLLRQLKPLESLQICNLVELTEAALAYYQARDVDLIFSSKTVYSTGLHVLLPPLLKFGSIFRYEHSLDKKKILDISYSDQKISTLWIFKVIDAASIAHATFCSPSAQIS
ncbi:unnamed protein product [Enterobius vermicularis]|uniref:F-box domain-containing protein n=1 Tax=Enterobius vermicularis TaxID=51028 RepID=A0A158QAP3_ENTVE|nr:unnamed protein product [Enterobius vermicularis]